MATKKTGVLLINLGTPDNPSTGSVRNYLSEFLNDPRVIDINAAGRAILVNGIIVPFRAPKSAKIYKELWHSWNGQSPLLTYGLKLQQALQDVYGTDSNMTIEFAMRYKNPSLDSVLERMQKSGYERILIFPLFPHYASSSSGSAIEKAMNIIRKWWVIPEIRIISQFFNDPGYIAAFIARGREYDLTTYDHFLFSYHGLPERQINKVHPDLKCSNCNCNVVFNSNQPLCYRNECYETTRLIAEGLGIAPTKYTVAFQSRLGKTPWLRPYSDQVIEELAQSGKSKILAFSPAFVADCLETTVEIGVEYQAIIEKHGGDKIQLVQSLNDSKTWVDAAKKLIDSHLS